MAIEYSDEIAVKICELLCDGVPLEEICRMDGMPSAWTVHAWKSDKLKPKSVPDNFPQDIARARAIGYDVIASRTRQTARGEADSTQDVQRDKLIIDTDLKLLSKWTKKYSNDVTVKGDEENPLKFTEITRVVVDPKNESGN